MREIKKVLICGLGAIGSIYANAINIYAPDSLKILTDAKRRERYLKAPKIFNGKELNLNYILPEQTDFKADLVIIATKYSGLADVIKNIENFVSEDTIIISLVNGVTSESEIARKYGWKNILHSYYIGGSCVRIGNNITYPGNGTIVFGVKDANLTDIENLDIVKNYFDKVGIKYSIPEDIWHSVWLKYMLNVSSNQLSAVMGLTFGQMNTPECKKLLVEIMKEVQSVAAAKGVNNTEIMIDEALNTFGKMTPEGKTSMLQDIEAKRHPEVEIFAQTMIKFGEEFSIPVPYNKMLNSMIKIIESQW